MPRTRAKSFHRRHPDLAAVPDCVRGPDWVARCVCGMVGVRGRSRPAAAEGGGGRAVPRALERLPEAGGEVRRQAEQGRAGGEQRAGGERGVERVLLEPGRTRRQRQAGTQADGAVGAARASRRETRGVKHCPQKNTENLYSREHNDTSLTAAWAGVEAGRQRVSPACDGTEVGGRSSRTIQQCVKADDMCCRSPVSRFSFFAMRTLSSLSPTSQPQTHSQPPASVSSRLSILTQASTLIAFRSRRRPAWWPAAVVR